MSICVFGLASERERYVVFKEAGRRHQILRSHS